LLYLDIFLRCEMRGWFKTLSAIAVLVLVQGWIWTTWDTYNILFQQNTLHFMQNHPALSFYFCYESSMCNHLVVSLWTSNNCKFVNSIELSCKYHLVVNIFFFMFTFQAHFSCRGLSKLVIHYYSGIRNPENCSWKCMFT
jgi:hypothetical protein